MILDLVPLAQRLLRRISSFSVPAALYFQLVDIPKFFRHLSQRGHEALSLDVAEEEHLQGVAIEDGDPASPDLLRGVLQFRVRHVHDVGDVEWAVLGRGLVTQRLVVDVSCGRHDEDVLAAVRHEGQGAVMDLARGNQEVVLRAEDILAQVVDLNKVGGDERQLRLGSRHPERLDDKVVGVQLRMQHQVVGDGTRLVEDQDVAVLEASHGQVILIDLK